MNRFVIEYVKIYLLLVSFVDSMLISFWCLVSMIIMKLMMMFGNVSGNVSSVSSMCLLVNLWCVSSRFEIVDSVSVVSVMFVDSVIVLLRFFM